jgi:hypothetical protein
MDSYVTRFAVAIAAALPGLTFVGTVFDGAGATDCAGSAQPGEGWVDTVLECNSEGSAGAPSPSNGSHTSSSIYTAFRWELACEITVGAALTCADWCPGDPPDDLPYRHLGLHDGIWEPLKDVRCSSQPPGDSPSVTPALVARAFQRIPLPALRAVTQPAGKTLINFDTIFYVQAKPLRRTLTLLGQRVELAITPSTYRWVHGDGTTSVTHTPGAAYPAKDVVYRYQDAHVTVMQHVEIIWTARWSLNGRPYQDVDGTVTTVGPATALRIAEATPALSGYGH